MDELYALYRRCFPDYPAAEAVFRECLKRERGQVLYAGEGGETVGYALIHGGSLSLLCVDRRYRNRGHGAALLEAAETRIRASGADRVLLGRGRYYLLQGVPAEDPAVPAFFERRGYAASWTSVNMRLDLRGFGAGRLDIPPAPETVGFRFARDADRAALLAAVDDAQPDWRGVFTTCADPVLLAVEAGAVLGFAILSPGGGRFSPPGERDGCIGCVGVVGRARRRGIGRGMVVYGAEWLKSRGCTGVELRYVELVNWYRRIGFTVTRRQWMGEKALA